MPRRILISVFGVCLAFMCDSSAAEFRVGVVLPLAGPFSEYGVAIKNGIELARREHGDLLSSLRFIYEDDGYDPKRTIAAFNKLVDIQKINLFFVWGNEPALGVAPVAERRKFPSIVAAQHPSAGAGYKYVIRFINPAADYGQTIAAYLHRLGVRRIVMLKSELSFFDILISALKNHLYPGQELFWVENFLPTDSDFKPTIAKLRKRKFDALGLYLNAPQVIQYYRQASQLGYHAVTFGSTPFESISVIEQAYGSMDGAFYAHLHVDPHFRDHYMQEYGNDIEVTYAANSYEFAAMAGRLFGSLERSLSAEEIIEAFSKVPAGRGANGRYRFRETAQTGKYFEFEMAVKKIEGGKIVELAPLP